MKQIAILPLVLLILIVLSCNNKNNQPQLKTLCNPVDISYRFALDEPSRREAADPTVAWFKDRYYLFASKSGGYWQSQDLSEWTFIETDEIPTEEYAPTVIAIGDTLFFLASSNEKSTIYKTSDPLSGEWQIAVEQLEIPVWDPAFFLDDDNRLYLYWGCSNQNPIYGVEIDFKNNFSFIGKPQELINANPEIYGWEVPGDYNSLIFQAPWIEGAWMTKKNGIYYLQYSGPGTEFKSYADGVYTSTSPLGSFTLQPHNPFAYKPEGFAAGAGHGSSFSDKYGNYWQIGTITISEKHMFERRLGLYPAFLDSDGTFYTVTKYGDYPFIFPEKKISTFDEIFPGWMLLTFRKMIEVSSSVDTLCSFSIVDENIRTYWAAQSGGPDEYATIDMGDLYDVYALQVNFAEHDTKLFGKKKDVSHKYLIEGSTDGENWEVLIDKSDNKSDNTHNYFQLTEKINCRYLKITNIEVPDGNFALSGFRAFGKGNGVKPEKVSEFISSRNIENRRSVTLNWNRLENTMGYTISYGVDPKKLYHNYIVYNDTTVTISSLNSELDYYFTIEAFNENGITPGETTIKSE
jgi:xylan 1,4-beta-xylosidase